LRTFGGNMPPFKTLARRLSICHGVMTNLLIEGLLACDSVGSAGATPSL
jgi:hypothetical protein